MATIEVVQGIAEASSSGLASNSATKVARRKTLTRSFAVPNFLRSSGSFKGKGKGIDKSPLAFTSWRKPPGYVGASGVLVQTWAVAVDNIDYVLVKGAPPSLSSSSPQKRRAAKKEGESTRRAEVGFIPGRSFVGRVLECGWEVGEETIKKNDWVVGLLDVKKVFYYYYQCGYVASLTSFVHSVVLWRNLLSSTDEDCIEYLTHACQPTAQIPTRHHKFMPPLSKS
jgi:hypothetical protein